MVVEQPGRYHFCFPATSLELPLTTINNRCSKMMIRLCDRFLAFSRDQDS